MFTRMSYKLDTPTKTGFGVVKMVGEDNSFTIVTKTVVNRYPKVPIPGRGPIVHSTRLVQSFHNETAALSEYNRQKASLEHAQWKRTK